MPYIRKELRLPFDMVIEEIKQGSWSSIDIVIEKLEKTSPQEVGGQLNYLLTQLFRKLKFDTALVCTKIVLHKLFWIEPRYYKFEQVYGTLNAIIDEWNRRKWDGYWIVVDKLKTLLEINRLFYGKYEDEKIKENGDV